MTDEELMTAIGNLLPRADKFTAKDPIARSLTSGLRSVLKTMAEVDQRIENVGAGNYPLAADIAQRTDLMNALRERESELLGRVYDLESTDQASKNSSNSVTISWLMLFVVILSTGASAFQGWVAYKQYLKPDPACPTPTAVTKEVTKEVEGSKEPKSPSADKPKVQRPSK